MLLNDSRKPSEQKKFKIIQTAINGGYEGQKLWGVHEILPKYEGKERNRNISKIKRKWQNIISYIWTAQSPNIIILDFA